MNTTSRSISFQYQTVFKFNTSRFCGIHDHILTASTERLSECPKEASCWFKKIISVVEDQDVCEQRVEFDARFSRAISSTARPIFFKFRIRMELLPELEKPALEELDFRSFCMTRSWKMINRWFWWFFLLSVVFITSIFTSSFKNSFNLVDFLLQKY